MTIQTINIGTTPNDNTGDDPRTAGQKLNSNFTTSTHAASRDVGTATGNIPTADDLGMVGETNYTSGNYQPEVVLTGLNVSKRFINLGANIASGAEVSGADIYSYRTDINGNVTAQGQALGGTVKNTMSGTISTNTTGDMVKIA